MDKIDNIDALEKSTITMCDIEVIFQILIEAGITTKEDINKWRMSVACSEPFKTLFNDLKELKKNELKSLNGS